MATPIEGVDYIVDRYAVLGVAPDSDAQTIHKAVRDARARNHPDRLGRASEKILLTARRQMELINRAAEVLEDPDLRAGYDERLAHFRQHEPELISTTGVAMVSLTRQHIDVDALMAGTIAVDVHTQAFAEFAQITGHTPEALARAERLLAALPDDPDTRALARQARVHHWIHCLLDQQVAWTNAGVNNRHYQPKTQDSPYEIVDHTRDYLDHLTEKAIPDLLALRHGATALKLAPPLRLLGHDGSLPAGDGNEPNQALVTAEAQAAAEARVLASFKERSEAVLDAAHQTQEALAKALELTPFHVFRQAPVGAPIDFIVVLGEPQDDNALTPIAALRLIGTTIVSSPDGGRPTVGAWKADNTLDPGVTRVLLGHDQNIEPILAEVWWAVEHLEALGLEAPLSAPQN